MYNYNGNKHPGVYEFIEIFEVIFFYYTIYSFLPLLLSQSLGILVGGESGCLLSNDIIYSTWVV